MISFSIFFYKPFLAQLPLSLSSHLDLIVNLKINIGDTNEASGAKESRRM